VQTQQMYRARLSSSQGWVGAGGRGRPRLRTWPAGLPRQRPPDPQAMRRPDPGPWPAAGQGRA